MFVLDLFVIALMTYFSIKYHSRLPGFLGSLISGPTPGIVKNAFDYVWAVVLTLLPVFSAVFFGSPALSSEIESKTAFNVFPLPISRYTLHLGKFLAALAATAVILLIFSAGQYINFVLIYQSFEIQEYYTSLGLSIVFAFSILSITFLVSAVFNKNLYAYITVFLLYFLIFDAINIVWLFLYGYLPSYLLSNAASIIVRVYINIDPFTFSLTGTTAPAGISLIVFDVAVMLVYSIVALTLSLIIFDRREVR